MVARELPEGATLGDNLNAEDVRPGEEQLPHVSTELVRWLKANYPPKCKSPLEPLEGHMVYAGMVQMVTKLEAMNKLQQPGVAARVNPQGTGIEVRPENSRMPTGRRPSVPRTRQYIDREAE